ncbi:MAG: FHA domain-containing protein [Bacillota bacterium]
MLKKFLQWINIPRHIKKYFLRRKIRQQKKSEQVQTKPKNLMKIINFLIIVMLLGELIYLNLNYENDYLLIGSIILVVVIFVFFLIKLVNEFKEDEIEYQDIKQLILKDETGKIANNWELRDEISLLVGKQAATNNVDVDLSQATYSSLISREHAVLNKANNKWYFEDLNSLNGSGIRRKHNNEKFKVEAERPYKLNSGDTLYIANTKLVIK